MGKGVLGLVFNDVCSADCDKNYFFLSLPCLPLFPGRH